MSASHSPLETSTAGNEYENMDKEQLKKLAKGKFLSKGNPAAQYALALRYKSIKPEKYMQWMVTAAKGGYAVAQYIASKEQFCKTDDYSWYYSSAQQGYLPAELKVIEFFLKKVTQNAQENSASYSSLSAEECLKWIERIIIKDPQQAIINLAEVYIQACCDLQICNKVLTLFEKSASVSENFSIEMLTLYDKSLTKMKWQGPSTPRLIQLLKRFTTAIREYHANEEKASARPPSENPYYHQTNNSIRMGTSVTKLFTNQGPKEIQPRETLTAKKNEPITLGEESIKLTDENANKSEEILAPDEFFPTPPGGMPVPQHSTLTAGTSGYHQQLPQPSAPNLDKISDNQHTFLCKISKITSNHKLTLSYLLVQKDPIIDSLAIDSSFSDHDELKFIDNLHKFCCETINVNSENKAESDHLRIVHNPGIRWRLKKEGELYKLKTDLPPRFAETLTTQFRTYLRLMDIPNVRQWENILEYNLGKEEFRKWVNAFQEINIKYYKLYGRAPRPDELPVTKVNDPQAKEIKATVLAKLDELILKLSILKKYRQPDAKSEAKVLELLSDCQMIRNRLTRTHETSFAPFINRTTSALNDIIHQRLSHIKKTLSSRPLSFGFTHFKPVACASTLERDSRPNIVEILLNVLSKNEQRLLSNRLEKRSQNPSVYEFLTKAVNHLREKEGAITQSGLETVLLSLMIKNNRGFNPSLLAATLYKSYRRVTEQLDPYAEDKSEDPYSSLLYLPCDEYILIAKNEVDKQVSMGASIITLDPKADAHELEAIMLYCQYKGYNYSKVKILINETLLKEKAQPFAELFEKISKLEKNEERSTKLVSRNKN